MSSEHYKDFTHHLSASHNAIYQPNPTPKKGLRQPANSIKCEITQACNMCT